MIYKLNIPTFIGFITAIPKWKYYYTSTRNIKFNDYLNDTSDYNK